MSALGTFLPLSISLVPSELMNVEYTVLITMIVFMAVVKAVRPRTVTAQLDKSIEDIEHKFYGLELSVDDKKLSEIEDKLISLRIKSLELRAKTYLTSASLLGEFGAFFKGHSLAVVRCINNICALDAEMEVLKAQEEIKQIATRRRRAV